MRVVVINVSIKQKFVAFAFVTLFANPSLIASPVYHVTSRYNDGSGSLREALSSGISIIILNDSISEIEINDTLEYVDEVPLTIIGSGQTIKGVDSDKALLEIINGADLTIKNVNFTVDDQYSLAYPGGGKGILVDVPAYREGVVNLTLTDVKVTNVGQHGIHVSDCDVDGCGANNDATGHGSSASINVNLSNVTVENVGHGGFDSDGIRIDERDEGDIYFNAVNSSFSHVGADGVELDEGGNGNVIINIRNTVFDFNGAYCAGIHDLYAPEDATCIEGDDSELALDLDDGFDIDEAGEGSILGQINRVIVNNNDDEGLDFDEEGEGNIKISLSHMEVMNNFDEGIKFSEKDQGDVKVKLNSSIISDNHDDGVQFEEDGDGNINIMVNATSSFNNDKKDLKVTEDGEGIGHLKIHGSEIDYIKTSDDIETQKLS